MQKPPKFIESLATSKHFIKHVAGGDKALCDRLIGHPDMGHVWDEIETLARGDQAFQEEFLDACARLRKQWSTVSKLTLKQRGKIATQAANQAKDLADFLDRHDDEIRAHLGPCADLGNYLKAAASNVSKQSSTSISKAVDAVQKDGWKIDRSLMPSLASVLHEVANDLSKAHNWDHELPIPTKVNATSAERTYCVRALTKFFVDKTGSPHSETVAHAVTAVLNLPDPMDADHAGKIAKDLK